MNRRNPYVKWKPPKSISRAEITRMLRDRGVTDESEIKWALTKTNCRDAGKRGHPLCGWCPYCRVPRSVCEHEDPTL